MAKSDKIGTILLCPLRTIARGCRAVWRRYKALNWVGLSIFWFLIIFHVVLFALLIIYTPAKLAQTLYDAAQDLRAVPYGWLILVAVIIVSSFPPLVGYDTALQICGFTLGFKKGVLLAVPSALAAASMVFFVLRWAFKTRVQKWAASNDKWQALETVIRAKGLPLIILIRISGFPPWVYSNGFFASVEAVSFWQFFIATACTIPKMCLPVFIGAQVAAFSDGDQRGQMDIATKILNIVAVVVSVVLVATTCWLVYRWTVREIRKIQTLSPEVDESAVDVLEDVDEGAPLLHSFRSGDSGKKYAGGD